jgi:hypothetical protein
MSAESGAETGARPPSLAEYRNRCPRRAQVAA